MRSPHTADTEHAKASAVRLRSNGLVGNGPALSVLSATRSFGIADRAISTGGLWRMQYSPPSLTTIACRLAIWSSFRDSALFGRKPGARTRSANKDRVDRLETGFPPAKALR